MILNYKKVCSTNLIKVEETKIYKTEKIKHVKGETKELEENYDQMMNKLFDCIIELFNEKQGYDI